MSGLQVHMEVSVAEVARTLGAIPRALAAAFAFRNYDLLTHHRSRVISRARFWPGGRQAQKMVASRLWRYGRKKKVVEKIEDAVGEGFVAAQSGEVFGPDRFKALEEGGTLTSGGRPFAVPIEAMGKKGTGRAKALKEFARMLAEGELLLVGGRYLIYAGGKTRVKLENGRYSPRVRGGLRTRLVAVLARSRTEPPRLRFFANFDELQGKHLAKYEKAIEQSLTAAGQAALERKTERETLAFRTLNRAYTAAYRSAILAGQDVETARKAARLARDAVRKDRLGPDEGEKT